jgi:hypothetical protein
MFSLVALGVLITERKVPTVTISFFVDRCPYSHNYPIPIINRDGKCFKTTLLSASVGPVAALSYNLFAAQLVLPPLDLPQLEKLKRTERKIIEYLRVFWAFGSLLVFISK